MSGHSHWTQIKRQKGAQDAKRGTLFTKLGKSIAVAASAGGGSPDTNERLRLAIEQARTANMPNSTIERAIKRGTGGLNDSAPDVEIIYEGYGPGGVAVLVQTLTNNRNRTTAELRHIFSKYGGNLARKNSVNWMFESRGVLTISATTTTRESIVLAAIDAGAEEVEESGNEVIAFTDPGTLKQVESTLRAAGQNIINATIEPVPQNSLAIANEESTKLEKLFSELQEIEDVNNFFTNAQA